VSAPAGKDPPRSAHRRERERASIAQWMCTRAVVDLGGEGETAERTNKEAGRGPGLSVVFPIRSISLC
jgi:hypothetical protein